MSISFFRPDQPLPTVWSNRGRGPEETALDCESAVTLACHVNPAFAKAKDWGWLIDRLANAGFRLEFQNDRLVLVNEITDVGLCTCRFLGHSLAALSERLGKPCVQADTGRLVAKPAIG